LHRSLIRSHHHTAVDFIGQVKTKKKRERDTRKPSTTFKGQHMLFENKYNSMMMMMITMISVWKLFFHLLSKQHDARNL